MSHKYKSPHNKQKVNISRPKHLKELTINLECFPELSKSSINTINNNNDKMDFIVKLNKTADKIEECHELKPGYITIQYDKNKRNIIVDPPQMINKYTTTHNINFQYMIDKWTNYYNLYNEIYGEDIYEKTYLFPNYNYSYFDMLDDKYYVELDEEETHEEYQNDDYYDE